MIVLVSSQTKTFKFINQDNLSDESYCMITVNVEEKMHVSGQSYYDITYDYEYVGLESSKQFIHPFMEDNGVIVYKNKLSEIMIEYLLSDSEELQKVSGKSTAQHYRTFIMLNLKVLCD